MEKLEKMIELLKTNRKVQIGAAAGALALVLIIVAVVLFSCGSDPADGPDSQGGKQTYTVSVQTEGGLPFKDLDVMVYEDDSKSDLVSVGKTTEDGTYSFEADASDEYVAEIKGVPAGYPVEDAYTFTDGKLELVLKAELLPTDNLADLSLELGGVFADLTVTATDGKEYKISELLKEKKAVVLNFWFENCGPCRTEFPFLNEAYEQYKDKLEVLALSPLDNNDVVKAYKEEMGLNFPMAACDPQWEKVVGVKGYPTTIVIDRYGTMAFKHGSYVQDADTFKQIFEYFTADDYKQTVIESLDEIVHKAEGGDGTKGNPFQIIGVEFDAKVPAGGEVYYMVYKVSGMELTIADPNAYVVFEDTKYEPVDGVVKLTMTSSDIMAPMYFSVGNTASEEKTFKGTFTSKAGTYDAPFPMELGDVTVEIAEGNDQGVYYKLVATESGVLTLTNTSATDGVEFDFNLYNLNTYTNPVWSENKEKNDQGQATLSIEVNEGDEILFGVNTVPVDNVYPAGTFGFNASFAAGTVNTDPNKVEYSVTIKDQNDKAVVGAKVNIEGLGTLEQLTTDAQGVAKVTLLKGDYTATIILPGGYSADKTKFNLTTKKPTVTVKVKNEDNESGLPPVTGPQEYTVSVEDAKGTAQKGVYVLFYDASGMEVHKAKVSGGKVTTTLEAGTYTIKLEGVKSGWDYDKTSLRLTAHKRTRTVVVAPKAKMNSEYKLPVVTVGATYVEPDTNTKSGYGYVVFATDVSGKYEVTTSYPDAKIRYFGSPINPTKEPLPVDGNYKNNKFTVNITAEYAKNKVPQALGITGTEGCIVTIKRIGNAEEIKEATLIEYKGTGYVPSKDKIPAHSGARYDVDVTKNFNPVYNEADGFYHKDSKNGPIIYVDLWAAKYGISFGTFLGDPTHDIEPEGIGFYRYYTEGGTEYKEDYTKLMQSYIGASFIEKGAADQVYPLTEDLRYMLENGGKYFDWWGSKGNIFGSNLGNVNKDIAWMFACCYWE